MTTEGATRDGNWRWWVCGALLLATLLNYMDRQALAETATELKARFALGDARYGKIERGFSWAFAAGSIVFGVLADRFGPRKLYPIVLLGWSVAGIFTPFAASSQFVARFESPDDPPGTGTYLWLLGCRVALGFFEAGHWPCALLTARQILSAAERPFGNGLLQSGASLGAILTPLYAMQVRNAGGSWEHVFWTIGVVGLLWIPLWIALVRRANLMGAPPPSADGDEGPVGWSLVRRLFTLFVVVICLNLSWQFVRAWLPKYLKEFHGYSNELSAWTVAAYFSAADVGCILSGAAVVWLVRRGRAVHTSRVIAFAACVALSALAALIPSLGGNPRVLMPVLMLVGAGVLGLHPHYYALVQELPTKRMGQLSGLLAAAA
ncbi:MAG TPA: MFS transporter, partial [Gemmataceae bacterium]|nr:MFS transporter [Gemmataceae bacterium]